MLVANVTVGASFTGVRVMVKVLVVWFTPPSVVPPLSWAMTVTVAEPFLLAAGVNVSVPFSAMAGCTENSAVALLATV